jgi:hypothetical protein
MSHDLTLNSLDLVVVSLGFNKSSPLFQVRSYMSSGR